MAKNKAYTLAEVLITLGIIGIVAAMTIPTISMHITHKKLESQLKKTYADLNRATRTFYSDTDIPVHDYDAMISTSTVWRSDGVLKKFMSYYNGNSTDSNNSWRDFDTKHSIQNLNLNGTVAASYPCDQSSVYTDITGRLYVMDDTSLAYNNLSFGPKICVDINGIEKPNRWGYDRFVFVFTEDNAAIPYVGSSWSGLTENLTDKNEIAKYCAFTTTTPAHTCAYFALIDKSPTGNGSYWHNFLK